MQRFCLSTLLACAAMLCHGQAAPSSAATFSYFAYDGHDARFDRTIDPASQYFNPILLGFFPDPSICRKGDTYYLVCSSFAFFPGVPIFESKDLVNWQQIGFVLDRPSQVPLRGQGWSQGIMAPAISYNEQNDTFYMVSTNGRNFYVKTKDPHQGWSEPIYIDRVKGIDPSFFFDRDGKGYLVHNAAPFAPAEYSGQRAIHLHRFDVAGDSLFGPEEEIVHGGSHVTEKPFWIEGPHLFRVGDTYYLMCAEGGTGDQHSEVIFRAPSPVGPWEECPTNPILTQRDLTDNNRPDIVNSAGHAELVQTPEGDWWGVFLAARPYEDDFYNTGRDTYLLPVTWSDGWPTILPANTPIPAVGTIRHTLTQDGKPHLSGNFAYTDRFDSTALSIRWLYRCRPPQGCLSLSSEGLTLQPAATNLTQRDTLSAIFCRQQHTDFSAETQLVFTPQDTAAFAGMALVQNDKCHFTFGKSLSPSGHPIILLTRADKGAPVTVATKPLSDAAAPLRLRIDGQGRYYDFLYAEGTGDWQPLATHVDGVLLSTHYSGGFIGAMLGLYATTRR